MFSFSQKALTAIESHERKLPEINKTDVNGSPDSLISSSPLRGEQVSPDHLAGSQAVQGSISTWKNSFQVNLNQ